MPPKSNNAAPRIYEEDNCLPKYICARREEGIVIGYSINSFPIATNKYASNTFINRANPTTALKKATEFLENLQNSIVPEEATKEVLNLINNFDNIDEYIDRLEKDRKFIGYVAKGIKDKNGNSIPPKEFTSHTNSKHNLDNAKKYVANVLMILKNDIPVDDWSKIESVSKTNKKGADTEYIPMYLTKIYKGETHIGYRIQGLPKYDTHGNKIKDEDGKVQKYSKFFKDMSISLEDKYKAAIEHLDEMKILYNVPNARARN